MPHESPDPAITAEKITFEKTVEGTIVAGFSRICLRAMRAAISCLKRPRNRACSTAIRDEINFGLDIV